MPIVAADSLDQHAFDLGVATRADVETAERLRRVVPELPVALITGYADAAALIQSWNGRILKKPFELSQLAAEIAELRGTSDNVVPMQMR